MILWRRCIRRWFISPIAGFLLALLWVQLIHEFVTPNLPSLFEVEKAIAATGATDPNGDGSLAQATAVGTCLATGDWECVNDAVRQPTSLGTPTTDYLTFTRNDQNIFLLLDTPTNVQTATSVTVWMYHQSGATNFTFNVSLMNSSETVIAGPVGMTNRTTPGWGSVTFTGLSLNQAAVNGLRIRNTCVRSGGGNSTCTNYAMYADINYTPVTNIIATTTTDTQVDIRVGSSSTYVGAPFVIQAPVGTWSFLSATITENGTVHAQNDLSNIRMYYEYDTVTPFDCEGESYNGTESQYGSAGSFSGANGTVNFTQTLTASSTQAICLYPVLDVDSTATYGETIELQIANPQTHLSFSGTPVVQPTTAVNLPGTSTIIDDDIQQINYHWRNDAGNETGAGSVTGGTENTPFSTLSKGPTRRIRFAVSNEGNAAAQNHQFRLEHATKTAATCALVSSGWTDVGTTGGAFDMSPTANITDGANATDIAISIGGVSSTTNNTSFLTSNGGLRDTNSQTGNIALSAHQFVELEYAVVANSFIPDGTSFCFRLTDAGTPLESYTNYAEATIAADVLVSSIGSLKSTVSIPTTTEYAGGAFTIQKTSAGTESFTSFTLFATGTADIQNDIENIRIRYDLDTTGPSYTCDDTSYQNTDATFGSVVSNFNGSNEATFTGSLSVSPTQTLCLYIEYDVVAGATNGDIVYFRVQDPSSDVVVSNSTVSPTAVVSISGSTTLAAANVEQADYHWRNDDGNQIGATSMTSGSENTPITDIANNTIVRLRMGIANTGLASTSAQSYRLEWAKKVSSCAAATGWERADTSSDAFEMAATANLTNNADSLDIAISSGGVSNGSDTFLVDNNGIKTTDDTTNTGVVPPENYLDLEYSIRPTSASDQGTTYCFRVTNAGTELDTYTNYPEITMKLDSDFSIQRGTFTMTGTSTTIFAGTDYAAPTSTSRAFIRITNTQMTGAGPNTGAGNNNADNVTVYMINPNNLLNSVTFARSAFPSVNTRVSWEIIEYTGPVGGENEIIVRRHEPLTFGGGTTVSGTSMTVSDDNDMAVFVTSHYNPDSGRNNYNESLATAAWNAGSDSVTLTRGGSNSSIVTYAAVEFTGSNWTVQRVENTYSNASTTETQGISAVGSLSRAFLHTQKRTTLNNHADYGHEVWLSGITQVSFKIDGQAGTPGSHTSVAWVISNAQTDGTPMAVYRSLGGLGSGQGGAGPVAYNISIGTTIDDLSVASIFTNNRSDESQRSWPEPILGARIISSTQYELWRSDTSSNIVYRTEVVLWPSAAPKFEQTYFAIYENETATTSLTDRWGSTDIGENTPMGAGDDPMANGDIARIRMTVRVVGASLPAGLQTFKLQYGKSPGSCLSASYQDVGAVGSTTAPWRAVDNAGLADGLVLSTEPPNASDLLISIASAAGTYEESNPTALNPYLYFPDDEVEFDWVVQHNGADDKSSYCFRMVEGDGTPFPDYTSSNFPVLRTVGFEPQITNWRWYDDETNITPSTALANENVTPSSIANDNSIKLRLVLDEVSGAPATDVKFTLEYSEYADFSQSATVTATSTCLENSLWCFADGAGVDNAQIDTGVLSDAVTCSGGVGVGCGTHNETASSTIGVTFDHGAFTAAEYEFTIQNAGARARAVYYFRLYDTVNDEYVGLSGGSTYPSVQIEGAQLVFSVGGLPSGTTTAGEVTDFSTTPTSINFDSIPINTDLQAAQRLTINTNATEGYQVLKYATQQLMNSSGDTIDAILATNAVPDGWGDACLGSAIGCFGYHTTDATLQGGSGRFGPLDSYAALHTSQEEIAFSSVPANDTVDILYRVWVSEEQPPGDYEGSIIYIAVPVF